MTSNPSGLDAVPAGRTDTRTCRVPNRQDLQKATGKPFARSIWLITRWQLQAKIWPEKNKQENLFILASTDLLAVITRLLLCHTVIMVSHAGSHPGKPKQVRKLASRCGSPKPESMYKLYISKHNCAYNLHQTIITGYSNKEKKIKGH